MATRVTLFFSYKTTGWSESIHSVFSAPGDILPLAISLARARIGICGNDVSLIDVRISDDNVAGDIIADVPNLPFTPTIDFGPADPPFVSADHRLIATNLYRRLLFLRGLPDSQSTGGTLKLFGPFGTAYFGWQQQILNGKWVLMSKNRTATTARILQIANTGVMSLFSPIGVAAGDVVQILRVPRRLTKQRLFRVLTVDGSGLVISLAGWPAVQYLGAGATARKLTLVGNPITTCNFIRFGKRGTGRPFGVPRGRAVQVK